MNVYRIDFIGLTVLGPGARAWSHYKPAEWPGWSVGAEGGRLLLREDRTGKYVSLPLTHCVLYHNPATEPEAKGKK